MRVAAGIRAGKLCKGCGKKCKDEEGIELECPNCNGLGCESCDGGRYTVPECPKRYCQSVAGAIQAYSIAEKYGLPVAGGTLDQSSWFMDLAAWFGNEEARFELESIKE